MRILKKLIIATLIILTLVFAVLPLCIRGVLFLLHESAVNQVVKDAESLVAEVPYFREQIQNNMDAINDVWPLFEGDPYLAIQPIDDSTIYVRSTGNEKESLQDSSLFSQDEKEIISSLFSEQGLFSYYTQNIFTIKGSPGEAVSLSLWYMPSDPDSLYYVYYAEKISGNWYLCVTIDRMNPTEWVDKRDAFRQADSSPTPSLRE